MKDSLVKEVEKLDKEYFKERPLARLISALAAQADSLKEEPTEVNARKQLGDILFIIVAISRNMSWNLDEVLEETVVKVKNRRSKRHYYEAHVTIEPVFGVRRKEFEKICEKHGFRAAKLLMQKRKSDTPTRSKNDSFCTGRSISRSDMEDRMFELVADLKATGFQVWRYKTESTLLDSRYDDSRYPLDQKRLPERERKPRAPANGALAGKRTKKAQ